MALSLGFRDHAGFQRQAIDMAIFGSLGALAAHVAGLALPPRGTR
jgi:hypothetical protein